MVYWCGDNTIRNNSQERSTELRRLRQLADAIPHMVWIYDINGVIKYRNQAWYNYFQTNQPTLGMKKDIHPDDSEHVIAAWKNALTTGQPYQTEARLWDRVENRWRWFLNRAVRVENDNGTVTKWFGTSTDIDDQKLKEQRLKEDAEKKRFFLNAISHDLRAPLNALVLQSEVLRTMVDTEDSAISEALDVIQSNSEAAGEMLTRLLDFARLGLTSDNSDAEIVRLSAIIASTLKTFSAVAVDKGLYIKAIIPQECNVKVDRCKLERILANLIENAIKFTNVGGITITFQSEGTGVSIFVSDTGCGIAESDRDRMFGEFYQAGNRERDRKNGFGLGLAISRVLAEQISANVELFQSGPTGSTFVVRLNEACHDTHVIEPDHASR